MSPRKHNSQSAADAEVRIVTRAKDRLRHVERWGRWYHAFCWGLGMFWVGLLIALCLLIGGIAKDMVAAGKRPDFFLGAVLGSIATGGLFQMAHSILRIWRRALPDPTDRLLVQYHDALAQSLADEKDEKGSWNL